jgi:hypothetical protein
MVTKEGALQQQLPLARFAGILLAIGGILFFIAGLLHPHSMGGNLLPSIVAMLSSPLWACAHWISYISVVLITLAIWLLLDHPWANGSITARAGSRLTIIGGLFMMVEFAVELAAQGAMGALAAGHAVPIFYLFAVMHAAGWPTIGAGFIVLVLGIPSAAPLPIRILGIVGALAMGLGGVLVAGFYLTSFGALFIGGDLLAIWIVWAGVQIARGATRPKNVTAEPIFPNR